MFSGIASDQDEPPGKKELVDQPGTVGFDLDQSEPEVGMPELATIRERQLAGGLSFRAEHQDLLGDDHLQSILGIPRNLVLPRRSQPIVSSVLENLEAIHVMESVPEINGGGEPDVLWERSGDLSRRQPTASSALL
jgi:hypothetical protein